MMALAPPIRSPTPMSMTDGSGEPEVVLVVTASEDSTADAVEIELTKRCYSVVRFDTGDFPPCIRVAVRNDSTRWRGQLVIGSDVVDLDAVKAVYYRRPSRFVLSQGLSAGDAAFAITEARLGFGGPVTMVGSEPFAVAIHAGFDTARVDWRADYRALRYERIEPPPEVVEGARRYLTTFGPTTGPSISLSSPAGHGDSWSAIRMGNGCGWSTRRACRSRLRWPICLAVGFCRGELAAPCSRPR